MNDHNNQSISSVSDIADALDRWGSDLHHWPSQAATSAKRLLENSPEAIRLMKEAVDLETEFLQLRDHVTTPGLERKILAELPPRDSLQRIADWLTGALWRPALAAAVPLVVGFVLGITVPEEDSQLADELSLLVFSETYEELEDDS